MKMDKNLSWYLQPRVELSISAGQRPGQCCDAGRRFAPQLGLNLLVHPAFFLLQFQSALQEPAAPRPQLLVLFATAESHSVQSQVSSGAGTPVFLPPLVSETAHEFSDCALSD